MKLLKTNIDASEDSFMATLQKALLTPRERGEGSEKICRNATRSARSVSLQHRAFKDCSRQLLCGSSLEKFFQSISPSFSKRRSRARAFCSTASSARLNFVKDVIEFEREKPAENREEIVRALSVEPLALQQQQVRTFAFHALLYYS